LYSEMLKNMLNLMWWCFFAGFEGMSFPCNCNCSSICCWNCSC
jgi:hypothetical protein